jgi:hypothetical protein
VRYWIDFVLENEFAGGICEIFCINFRPVHLESRTGPVNNRFTFAQNSGGGTQERNSRWAWPAFEWRRRRGEDAAGRR